MKRLYQATRRLPDADRCDLCAAPLVARHTHLFDPGARELRCACQGCALIIPTSERARYRRVPDRREPLALDTARWLPKLGVPVGIAAVMIHDDGRAVVGYPGPTGLVESELDEPAWRELRAEVPAAASLAREVEAIVCSSLAGGGAWLVGIDVVFEMISELRASWRGLTGGPEPLAAVARLLAGLGAAA